MVTYDARPSAFTQLSTTADWESFMSSAGIADGVDGPASFVPSLDTGGRNAVISAGQGVIKGQLWRADAPVSTPVPAASAQNRLDRLVLRLNRGATSSPGVVTPTVITGTPSGTPVLPPIVQTPTGIYDVPVSYWTSASAGGLTTLVDQRQFSGRSIVMMTSAYHPSPVSPCLGFESDTGSLFAWNGTIWTYITQQQVLQPDSGIYPTPPGNITGTAYAQCSLNWPIPAGDARTPGTTYELTAWGDLNTGATNQTPTWQISAFGQQVAQIAVGGAWFVLNQAYEWKFTATVMVQTPGNPGAIRSNLSGFLSMFGTNLNPASGGQGTGGFCANANTGSVDCVSANSFQIQAKWSAVVTNQNLRAFGGYVRRIGQP